MPFVTVEIVGGSEGSSESLAQQLAEACSPAFPPEHREVWVRVRRVSESDWAITGRPGSRPLPVFVSVVREENPTGEDLKREIRGLTEAVARVTGRPSESIAIEYEPSARRRLAFGGNLLE